MSSDMKNFDGLTKIAVLCAYDSISENKLRPIIKLLHSAQMVKHNTLGLRRTLKYENLFCFEFCFKDFCSIFNFDFFAEGGVIFFTDPLAADDSKPDCDNIRIMILTKVTVAQ